MAVPVHSCILWQVKIKGLNKKPLRQDLYEMSLIRQSFGTGLPKATFAQAVPEFFSCHFYNHHFLFYRRIHTRIFLLNFSHYSCLKIKKANDHLIRLQQL